MAAWGDRYPSFKQAHRGQILRRTPPCVQVLCLTFLFNCYRAPRVPRSRLDTLEWRADLRLPRRPCSHSPARWGHSEQGSCPPWSDTWRSKMCQNPPEESKGNTWRHSVDPAANMWELMHYNTCPSPTQGALCFLKYKCLHLHKYSLEECS